MKIIDSIAKSKIANDSAKLDEASNWFALRQGEQMTAEEYSRYSAWLGKNPKHSELITELDEVWLKAHALADTPEVQAARAHAERLVQQAANQQDKAIGCRHEGKRSRLYVLFALAASLVIALGMANRLLAPSKSAGLQLQTALGEQRTVELEDGSSILLNTLTSVAIHYTATERRIELQKGQAGFKVAPDSARPFSVRAGAGVVTALGTEFDVYKRSDRAAVTLFEGAVVVRALKPGSGSNSPMTSLQAGQQVEVTSQGELTATVAVDIQQVSAWKHKEMRFDDTPLADVLAEANRYSLPKIEYVDPRVGELLVSGVYDVGKNAELVESLTSLFGLIAKPIDNHLVLLSLSESAGAHPQKVGWGLFIDN